jgi:hypothetical protein
VQARAAGFVHRAVAAHSTHGDQDGFRDELAEAGLPFVLAQDSYSYGEPQSSSC